jgi:hypothetical protein
MAECRKARKRPIPFDCKFHAGHEGNCSPYTLPPTGNWITQGFTPSGVPGPAATKTRQEQDNE